MMRILATALTAAVLFGASQTFAADEPMAAPSPAAPPPSAMPAHTSRFDPNEVICKREQSTESRLGGAKICHTRQEWTDMSASARDNVNSMQMTGRLAGAHP